MFEQRGISRDVPAWVYIVWDTLGALSLSATTLLRG